MKKFFVINLKVWIATILILVLLLSCISISINLSNQSTQTRIKVPIIMYHSILKDKKRNNKYVISPSQLESDILYIRENGYTTIFVSDLVSYVYDNVPLPDKPIILTFDDGDYNNLTYAYPLLEKYDMKAVISIVGSYTDTYTKSGETNPNYSYLRWSDIQFLYNSNRIEFGNHTYDLHKSFGGRNGAKKKSNETLENYKSVISQDILKLQDEFKSYIDITPSLFTYPFGSFCKESVPIIKDLGFKSSLSCTEGINYITDDSNCLFGLKRFNRSSRTSTSAFFKKIEIMLDK